MVEAARYRILRRIATGGAAEIFEARASGEMGFEKRVAIKRLSAAAAEDEALVRAFVGEARIAGRLSHPNIVPVIDFGLMDGLPFLVLEPIDGLDLEALVERVDAVIPEPIALHITMEVCSALDHAHNARDDAGEPLSIVHRDVQPRNILVSYGGEVKLTDFGIARSAQRLEQTAFGIAKGTRAYMSPEQELARDVDARSDLFSLGCVLHLLLLGVSPAEDRPSFLGGSAAVSSKLSPDIFAVIDRACRLERRERFASAAEMRAALSDLLARRFSGDPRQLFRQWIIPLAPQDRARPRHAVADLFDIRLIAGDSAVVPARRFETVRPLPVSPDPAPPPEEDPAELRLGQVIRGYKLEALLGEGGLARVYRARHEMLDRVAAIKILRAAKAQTTSARRMVREAQLAARVRHPNLVEILDCGLTDDGVPFVTMELLDGPSLREVLAASAPLPPALSAHLVRQIAVGLNEAHINGLVHRDLKPANLVVIGEGLSAVVKIVDFGIAKAIDLDETRLTKAAGLLGSPKFMSPEQITNAPDVRAPGDLYALGVTLVMMLTGAPPFTGTIDELIDQHLHAPVPPLPFAGGLGPLAERLLAKDAAQRPTAAEVIAAIDAMNAPDGETSVATVTAPTTPMKVVSRSPRRRLIELVAVFSALAAGAIAVFALRAPAPVVIPEERAAPEPAAIAARTTEPSNTSAPPEPAPVSGDVSEKPRRKVRPPPSKTDPPRPRSTAELEATFRRALSARGLEPADLEKTAALARFRSALREKDSAAAEEALPAVLEEISAIPIDPALVQRRLRRASDQLTALAKKLEPDQLKALETRYFALRERLHPRLDPAGCRALAQEVAKLEADLATIR